LQIPKLVSHVMPDGHAPPLVQSGTQVPEHGYPEGQQTSDALLHGDDDEHDVPIAGPVPASPPPIIPPPPPPPLELDVTIVQRWMNGYVSVM
jgi:hypothetical protein